jgi:hypothetical protein
VRAVRAVARVARGFAFAAAASAILFALALYNDGAWLVLALAAAVPAVVLFLFSFALAEAAELPARLRNAPAQVAGLGVAFDELARARGTRLPRALLRAGRHAASARDLAVPWAPLLPLLNLPFLGATALSAFITPFLLLASVILLATQL